MIPVACNLNVFDTEQHNRHRELIQLMNAAVLEVRELPDGYAFVFPSDSAKCQDVMAFATLERLCCPFFTFRLELMPQGGPLVFSLTGPAGTKDILRNFLRDDVLSR